MRPARLVTFILLVTVLVILLVVFLHRPPDPIAVFKGNLYWGIDFVTDELGFPYRAAEYETKGLKETDCVHKLDQICTGWQKETKSEGQIRYVNYQRKSNHALDAVRIVSLKGEVKELDYYHELTPIEVALLWKNNGYKSSYVDSSSITWP